MRSVVERTLPAAGARARVQSQSACFSVRVSAKAEASALRQSKSAYQVNLKMLAVDRAGSGWFVSKVLKGSGTVAQSV